MGKNAQFRNKIRNQKIAAQNRRKKIELEKQEKEAMYQTHHPLHHPLISHKYSERKKKELRIFEQKLLKGSQLEI